MNSMYLSDSSRAYVEMIDRKRDLLSGGCVPFLRSPVLCTSPGYELCRLKYHFYIALVAGNTQGKQIISLLVGTHLYVYKVWR